MMIQIIDPDHFDQKARQIKARVSTVLSKWGLLPQFKSWLLTQDPDTGMIVLFGVLNNRYIATHTSIPFGDYFDPRLLHDLTNELQVQVVSGDSDGLRYAFILDRGRFGRVPTYVDPPFNDHGKLLVRVVCRDKSPFMPVLHLDTAMIDDRIRVRQNIRALMKYFSTNKPSDDIAIQFTAQHLPDILVMDGDEFNKQAAEHETGRLRNKRIKALFGSSTEVKG